MIDRTSLHIARMETEAKKGNRRRCLFRERDVTRAIRAVIAAGQPIRGIRIAPDGGILILVLDTDRGDNVEVVGYNEWDEVLK